MDYSFQSCDCFITIKDEFRSFLLGKRGYIDSIIHITQK